MRFRLEPVRRYGEHPPYTTLEPCGLCVGAAIMVTVGRVCFASNDLYAGGSRFQLDNPPRRGTVIVFDSASPCGVRGSRAP